MKRRISMLLALITICILTFAGPAYAVGDGNIDNGGGNMGQGSSENSWSPGNDGVRVTVVRAADKAAVTTPIDLTNKRPPSTMLHFGKVNKFAYNSGTSLHPVQGNYTYTKPAQALPKIISSKSLGQSSIEEIKNYFTDEQVIRSIASITGMQFDVLINGEYRLLIEPFAFYTFEGVMIATTATEAAMYDELLNGGLRARMQGVTHQNLPLAMFLETPDLGYSAWGGSRNSPASNESIKSSLGIGIVRFKGVPPETPEASDYDYEYRTNTEVITAVEVSGGESDPDHPVSVTFHVGDHSYTVRNIYYPDGDSQLAWIRWTTPMEPQTMTITVRTRGRGTVSKGTIRVNIVDLNENPPPNPLADDRNDGFRQTTVPSNEQVTSASWGIWRPWWNDYWVWHSGDEDDDGYWCDHGWWEFDLDRYSANLSASMRITPDKKAPTASGKTLKSGYGINEKITTNVNTSQSSAVTPAQNAVTYFPEFQYQGFWRLLERMNSGFSMSHEFKVNRYSTYGRRTHFIPIWYPDGSYTPYTWLIDCWTPAGMLSMNLSDTVSIRGNLWSDWHIAPQNPD